MTGIEFGELMATAQSVYNLNAKDEAAFKVWYVALNDLDYDIAAEALGRLIKKQTGFLSPADIRAEYQNVISPKPSFIEAYSVLTTAVSKYGRYQHKEALEYIERNSPEMMVVVKAMGFSRICNTDPQFTRGPVERMYKEVVTSGTNSLLLANHSDDISEIEKRSLPRLSDQ